MPSRFDEYFKNMCNGYGYKSSALKKNERLCKSVHLLIEERDTLFNELRGMEKSYADDWVKEPPYFYEGCYYPDPLVGYTVMSDEFIQLQAVIQYKKQCLMERLHLVFLKNYDLTNAYKEIISLVKKKPNLSYDELLDLTTEKYSQLEIESMIEFGVINIAGKSENQFWGIGKKQKVVYEERLKMEELKHNH